MNLKNTTLSHFNSFAKGKAAELTRTKLAVIYTRVSSKEQADSNMSLDTQRRICDAYAEKHGYIIKGCFGGTYESAKNDERVEFNAMLSFVKKSREKISNIIVYSVDRFSRSGANAIFIAEQLKKQGVTVLSVTQPTDTTTSSGNLQQSIQFIFSQYDNEQRKEKCVEGIKQALLRGDWVTRPPLGYDMLRVNGKRQIVANKTGKLLKKAFQWKLEGLSIEEIRIRLNEIGIKLCHQRVSETLRNPFYAGIIVHKTLDGMVVHGNQEKVISHEVFLQVNNLLDMNPRGYTFKRENDYTPLKRFLKCDTCGNPLRSYIVKKKNKHYYKCTTKCCKNNRSAELVNEVFKNVLEAFTIGDNQELVHLIRTQMVATYNQIIEGVPDDAALLTSQVQELEQKLHRLEIRFIDEDLSKELYVKYSENYRKEKEEIEQKLAGTTNEISNLDSCIDKVLLYASKLASEWASADFVAKQEIQNLVFPEGIRYNRQKDEYLTTRINSLFLGIAYQKQTLLNKKTGIPELNLSYSGLVAGSRIELPTLGL
jgi:site-specific DNA recombinase